MTELVWDGFGTMAFADGQGCCGGKCDMNTFKVAAFDAKDAEFLALANAMANGGTKAGSCAGMEAKKAPMSCCQAEASKKVAKKASKKAKARR
jgi:hypothetical protein